MFIFLHITWEWKDVPTLFLCNLWCNLSAEILCDKIETKCKLVHGLRNFVLSLFLPFAILRFFYYSLIYPIFSMQSYLVNYSEIYLKPLFILQKRTTRVICNKPFLATQISFPFKECKILKFTNINILCVSVYMYKNRNKFGLIGTYD